MPSHNRCPVLRAQTLSVDWLIRFNLIRSRTGLSNRKQWVLCFEEFVTRHTVRRQEQEPGLFSQSCPDPGLGYCDYTITANGKLRSAFRFCFVVLFFSFDNIVTTLGGTLPSISSRWSPFRSWYWSRVASRSLSISPASPHQFVFRKCQLSPTKHETDPITFHCQIYFGLLKSVFRPAANFKHRWG